MGMPTEILTRSDNAAESYKRTVRLGAEADMKLRATCIGTGLRPSEVIEQLIQDHLNEWFLGRGPDPSEAREAG